MSTHMIYMAYCLALFIFYLVSVIKHYRKVGGWDYHVVTNLGVVVCFMLYLGEYKALAITIGLGSVVIDMIIRFYRDHHPSAKRNSMYEERLEHKNDDKSNDKHSRRQKIESGDEA